MKKLKLYKLILIGQLGINLPVTLIIIGLPLIAFFLIDNLILKIISMILLLILGVALAWRLWGTLITKWRIWAFGQIEDPADLIILRDLAVQTALIWQDGHTFENTEIRTAEERLKIRQISQAINEAEQTEDINAYKETPSSVGYKINKANILFYLVLEIFILALSVMSFLLTDNDIISGFLLLIFCGVFREGKTHITVKHLFSDKYFLEFDNEFLQIHAPKKQPIKWENIMYIGVHKDERFMIVDTKEGNTHKSLKVDLKIYQIPDYKRFKKTVQVFVDRYKIKN